MAGQLSHRPATSTAFAATGPPLGAAPASSMNAFRVAAVVERLGAVIRSGKHPEPRDFVHLCMSLARGIDYAVANNEVPAKIQELPILIKQVYLQHCNNEFFQPAIMVLMISVKNACNNKWFLAKDAEELLSLANEIGRGFSSPGDVYIEPTSPPHIISKVMSRFLPKMKMGRILTLLEVKPGFGTFAVDFQIPRTMVGATRERIWLFVTQTDNILTSSCLITPSNVSFLLNGRAVDRRNNVSMDTGPQMPTNVTSMLKFGINLLQAIGQFNGDYIIVVAFMSVVPSLDVPILQDYVQPAASTSESAIDSEIIEGPSRISLNCPISFKRIKTPVKGHLCKHHQCFDYENFIEINSRRPSWRCPHCNQSVCYMDIRVDRNIVKVLEEVGENVVDVIIAVDGSWKPVQETDDHSDRQLDSTLYRQDGTKHESTRISNTTANVVDLTVEATDAMDTHETEDCKPSKDAVCGNLVTGNGSQPFEVLNISDFPRIEEDFWSGVLFACSAFNGTASTGICETSHANLMLNPVLTDAVSPALDREPVDVQAQEATQPITPIVPQSQILTPNNLQLQPSQVGNSIIAGAIGRPSIPRQVSRNPIAIQALPAPCQVPGTNQRPRTGVNPVIPDGSSMTSMLPNSASPVRSQASLSMTPTSDGANVISGEKEMLQQLSRSIGHPLSATNMPSSSMQHHSSTQSWDHQDQPYVSSPSQSLQQIIGLPATSQVQSTYRPSPVLHPEFRNSNQKQIPMNMSRHHLPPRQSQTGGPQGITSQVRGGTSISQSRFISSTQRASQQVRSPPSVPVQLQGPAKGPSFSTQENNRTSMGDHRGSALGGISQPNARTNDLTELPSEQNWQPTGRMRGSLSGRAYTAFSQFMIQPTLPVEFSTPQPGPTIPSSVPLQLQALLANTINTRAFARPTDASGNIPGTLGSPPE